MPDLEGRMSGYGYSGDDITLGGDPDSDDGVDIDRETEADLREIERLARASVNYPNTDGVSREAPTPRLGVGAPKPRRIDGYATRGIGGRKPKTVRLADGGSNAGGAVGGSPAPGESGDRPKVNLLSERISEDDGSIPVGRRGVVAPGERVRRKGTLTLPLPESARLRTIDQRYVGGVFAGCQFNAALKDIRFNVSGDIEVRITIPSEDRLEGIKLADAYGVDLQVIIKRRVYDDDLSSTG